jgi:hypothetical protein
MCYGPRETQCVEMLEVPMQYRILVSLTDDMDKSVAWVQNSDIVERCIGSIRNATSRRRVWLELRAVDANYRKNYGDRPVTVAIRVNEPTLVLNEWYRRRLGVDTNGQHDLDIKEFTGNLVMRLLRGFQIGFGHPDSNVRCATQAALIGLFLGGLGLVLGIVSLCS